MKRWHTASMIWVAASVALCGDLPVELEKGVFNSSAVCGQCHEDIYAMWGRSMHSAAFSDPIFQTAFLKAYWEDGVEAQRVCLSCHAPVAALTGDLGLENPLSREGVTCDFCHSVVSVEPGGGAERFKVLHDGIKRGPLADAESPVHAVARSKLHESSELCAGCHEYTNAKGVSVLSTYSEWKTSPQAAEGKTCQNCHMPATGGETVVASLVEAPRKSINLHNISGMHSAEQVRKAATVKILRIVRDDRGFVAIEVEVANVGSGHSIPTGLPTRKLVLEVVLFSRSYEVQRFERVYQKRVVDESGRPITEDHRVLVAPHRVVEDNRLRPGERRVERFVATHPPPGELRAEIRLRYLYEPYIVSRERISIDIGSDQSSSER